MEFYELKLLVESNARAIQALGDRTTALARIQEEAAEERQELRNSTLRLSDAILRLATMQEGVNNMVASLDSDRPTILARLNRIENKVDQILQQNKTTD